MEKYLTTSQAILLSVFVGLIIFLVLLETIGFWGTAVVFLGSFVLVYVTAVRTPCADDKVHPWE